MSNIHIPGRNSSTNRQTEVEALSDILRQLKRFYVEVTTLPGPLPTGASTEAKQDDEIALLTTMDATLTNVEGLIINMSGTLDDMFSLHQKANWSSIIGNSVEYNYYAGLAAGNPSGSTSNVETVVYKTGVSTSFTQTFEYDLTNKVIKITTT